MMQVLPEKADAEKLLEAAHKMVRSTLLTLT